MSQAVSNHTTQRKQVPPGLWQFAKLSTWHGLPIEN
jgi:hypothetical protein